MKVINFPKRKSLKSEQMDIEDFMAQVDYTTAQLDREFKDFQKQYGADKGLDDWMIHIEKETQLKNQKIQVRSKALSLLFEKRLNNNKNK
ncbi:hypothetical protein BOFE_10780 (plasmid) [Candidatus Borrelia fainii]|uniref:Uncharacterized protein n=1 Tax=Candidatus Borrelia fainii TaxID=2518322 RepID=A0ABN6UUW1_9SPIR|nr:hypothetical protein [Candidatus Borrelia fainii]BDU63538.1 hypothetical protein BOFE_10780 [Candidatus Borrelia fainii]